MASDEPFPYQRIVSDLRSEILSGQRAPGEKLPSENNLADRYGLSRPTVRRAIALLKAEGLAVTRQGRGAFVRPTPHMRLLVSGSNYRRHRQAGLSGFEAQAMEQGQVARQEILDVALREAPPEISVLLNLDEGAPVVVRQRLFLLDDEPVAFCDSFYPEEWSAGTAIAERENIRGGVHALIEDPDGPIRLAIGYSVEDLAARMPTHEEAAGLNLRPGVPVVRLVRTVFDVDDNPVEAQVTLAAADRHTFRYEVSMK